MKREKKTFLIEEAKKKSHFLLQDVSVKLRFLSFFALSLLDSNQQRPAVHVCGDTVPLRVFPLPSWKFSNSLNVSLHANAQSPCLTCRFRSDLTDPPQGKLKFSPGSRKERDGENTVCTHHLNMTCSSNIHIVCRLLWMKLNTLFLITKTLHFRLI